MTKQTMINDKFLVSSILDTDMPIGSPVFKDRGETCVFNLQTGDSDVVGTHDDHAVIVETIKFLLQSLSEESEGS